METFNRRKLGRAIALAVAFFCLFAIGALLFLGGCDTADDDGYDVERIYDVTDGADGAEDGEETDGEETTVSGLVIPLSEFTMNVKYYGIYADGTYMEVIAFKYNGTYRTAFNKCQVCYASKDAYFKQSGNYVVCQQCGNKFALSQVGVSGASSRSCDPYPIPASSRVQTADAIIIPDSVLISAKNLFKTWAGGTNL